MKLFLDSDLKERYKITFLCTNVRKSNKNKGKLGLAMVFSFFSFFAQLLWILIWTRPKVVYYPITATTIGWIGRDAPCLILCWIFRARTIIHLRASHFRLNFERFGRLTKWIVNRAFRTVSLAIVQADVIHKQFDGLINPKRIRTMYQAIDAAEYDNPDLNDYEPGKILFVGHLTQAKGYCDLVRVIEPVVSRLKNAKFYVAGTMRKGESNVLYNQYDGSKLTYEDPFEVEKEILQADCSEHYNKLGTITQEELFDVLKNVDIFVLPSYSEGFSRAITEAMSVGKPVVFTPVGAHKEVLENGVNGLQVEPGNLHQLEKAIVELVSNRELRNRIGEYNYQYVRENLDINIIANQFAEMIDETLGYSTKQNAAS